MYDIIDNKTILDINVIVEDLKNLLDSIRDKFPTIQSKMEIHLNDLVNRYSNNEEFLDKLNLIKKLTDDMAGKLERLEYFQEEYYFFLSIRNMINYIISNIKYYILYSSFVYDLSSLFCNLIGIKIIHLKNSTLSEYENDFDFFKKNFFIKKEFFYSNIYVCTHQYDDLVEEVTRILW